MMNYYRNRFTFIWTIENYFKDFKKVSEMITSPKFFAEDFGEFFVKLYPMGDRKDLEGYVTCHIWRERNNTAIEHRDVNCDVGIFATDSRLFSQGFKFESTANVIGTEKTITLEYLMNEMIYNTFTLRIDFINEDTEKRNNKECIVRTRFRLDKYFLDWKLNYEGEKQSISFWFSDTKYILEAHVLSNDFKIKLQHCKKYPHYAISKICLQNEKGTKISTKTVPHIFQDSNKRVLSFPMKDAETSIADRFTLKFEILVPNESMSSDLKYIEMNLPISDEYSATSLCEDFKKMYVDKIFSDVKFRLGHKILLAHKNVLSARSPVFYAMFIQDMSEKQTGIVDIPDVDPDTFDLFLRYFYYGSMEYVEFERVFDLLELADKYQVFSLMVECVAKLENHLFYGCGAKFKVLKILIVADRIQHGQLKESAIRCIKTNAAFVLKSNEWQEFISNNVSLASEVIMELSSDFKDVFQSS